MKTKLMIFLLLTSFVTDLTAQEKSTPAVDFGERVIQDYLSYYETTQRTYSKQCHFPDTHFWFEDIDTRQMAGGNQQVAQDEHYNNNQCHLPNLF